MRRRRRPKTPRWLWEAALVARGTGQLRDTHGDWVDWLVGPVLVLYGDDEFMEAL